MHVDRARFLLLTASIATGACTPPSGAKAPASDGDVEVAPPSIAIEPGADEPLPNEPPSEPAVDQGDPIYVVAPVRSLLQSVVQRERLTGRTMSLAVGSEYDLDDLLLRLLDPALDPLLPRHLLQLGHDLFADFVQRRGRPFLSLGHKQDPVVFSDM